LTSATRPIPLTSWITRVPTSSSLASSCSRCAAAAHGRALRASARRAQAESAGPGLSMRPTLGARRTRLSQAGPGPARPRLWAGMWTRCITRCNAGQHTVQRGATHGATRCNTRCNAVQRGATRGNTRCNGSQNTSARCDVAPGQHHAITWGARGRAPCEHSRTGGLDVQLGRGGLGGVAVVLAVVELHVDRFSAAVRGVELDDVAVPVLLVPDPCADDERACVSGAAQRPGRERVFVRARIRVAWSPRRELGAAERVMRRARLAHRREIAREHQRVDRHAREKHVEPHVVAASRVRRHLRGRGRT
jgi:hypothetical protein